MSQTRTKRLLINNADRFYNLNLIHEKQLNDLIKVNPSTIKQVKQQLKELKTNRGILPTATASRTACADHSGKCWLDCIKFSKFQLVPLLDLHSIINGKSKSLGGSTSASTLILCQCKEPDPGLL